MIRKQRAAGFTLIEVIVASIVLVIAIGFVTISFNQLSGRDADNQANKISRWLESLSDRSVLEGGLYGFRVMGNQLQAISWFDHQWFIVEHEGLVELPEDLIFSYTEDDQPVGFFSIEDLQELETTDSAGAILLEDDVVEHHFSSLLVASKRHAPTSLVSPDPHQHSICLTALLSRCLLYTSPSPRDLSTSRMPSSA